MCDLWMMCALARSPTCPREEELKYLRDHGVDGKVDEQAAIAGSTRSGSTLLMQVRSLIGAREVARGERPDLHAGTPPWERLKAILSIAANHWRVFKIMRIDVTPAYFYVGALGLVVVCLPVDDQRNNDWVVDEEQVRHARLRKQWRARLAEPSQEVGEHNWSRA